ncbi:MAG: hypothetical protein U0871_07300 [Gemmataceae bacterium]
MGRFRWAWMAGLVAAGPGCVVSVGDRPMDGPPVVRKVASPPAKETGFASTPRAPGEWVAKHPTATPQPAPEPPSADPAPPTLAHVPSVDPPPPPPDSPLVVAVRGAVENRPEETLEALKAFDPAAQKLLLELIPALLQTSRFDPARSSPHEVGMLVGQFDGLAAALAPRASLLIEKAVLCQQVKGYGLYDPYPEGQPLLSGSTAYLYLELRNVPIQEVAGPDGPRFQCRLGVRYRILNAAGEPVSIESNGSLLPDITITTPRVFRSQVRGYYDVLYVPLPRKPGAYRLEVVVSDNTPGRTGGQVTAHRTFRVQ